MLQVVWFKRDLRTSDHQPLQQAAQSGPVIALYVVEPDYWALPDTSLRQWQFTRESLIDLNAQLKQLERREQRKESDPITNAPLSVYLGQSGDGIHSVAHALQGLLDAFGPFELHSHEETGNLWTFERDKAVARWCRSHGVRWSETNQFGVRRPNPDRDDWAQWWNVWMTQPQYDTPDTLDWQPRASVPVLHSVDALPLCFPVTHDDTRPDHYSPAELETPGRQMGGRHVAQQILNDFFQRRGEFYRGSISSPITAENGCSRLSPYLALGCLGMRELVQALRERRRGAEGRWKASLSAFESRLWWHCHFIQKLEDQPNMEVNNLHPLTERLHRPFDQARFRAWQEGRTGWPLVDACMRYLTYHGWVNFRMRAMLVSVAAYPLSLPWQPVAQHLATLFTDYEPGIHYPQVQMQAGTTGINVPRMYNPILQAQRLDPTGQFVRRWVPELRQVSDQWIFEPWKMPPKLQQQANIRLGEDYPAPMVEFSQAVREARADLSAIRGSEFKTVSRQIGARHGSRKRSSSRRGGKSAASRQQMDLF